MKIIKSLFKFIKEWSSLIFIYAKTFFMSAAAKNNEILALRSQLAMFQLQISYHAASVIGRFILLCTLLDSYSVFCFGDDYFS